MAMDQSQLLQQLLEDVKSFRRTVNDEGIRLEQCIELLIQQLQHQQQEHQDQQDQQEQQEQQEGGVVQVAAGKTKKPQSKRKEKTRAKKPHQKIQLRRSARLIVQRESL